jgi:uncharacterized protein (TIGR03067 family)
MRLLSLILLLGAGVAVAAAGDNEAREKGRLKGTWRVVSVQVEGRDYSRKLTPKCVFTFTGDTVFLQDNTKAPECRIKLDPAKTPPTIDLTYRETGDVCLGIYERRGNDLRVCYAVPGAKRPTSFATRPGLEAISFRLKRARADDALRRKRLEAAANRADALREQGKWAAAIRQYEKALALCEDFHGPEHPQTGKLMALLADLYRQTSQYAKAEPLYTRAIPLAVLTFGPDHESVENLSNNLAVVCQRLGEFDRAETLFRQSLKLSEKLHGKHATATGVSKLNLGNLYLARGAYGDAHDCLEGALKIFREKLGDNDPLTARAWNALGVWHRTLGHYEQAEGCYRRALRALEKAPPKDAVEESQVQTNLAMLYQKMGRFEKSAQLLRASLKVLEKNLPRQQVETAVTLNNLATALWKLNRPEEALPLLARGVELLEAAVGDRSPFLAKLLHNRAEIRFQTGHGKEAGRDYLRSQQILEAALGPNHPDVAIACLSHGAVLLFAGKAAEGEPYYRRALDITRKALGTDHPLYARMLMENGILQVVRGEAGGLEKIGRGLAIQQRQLERVFAFSSEPAMRDYLALADAGWGWLVTLTEGRPKAGSAAVRRAFNWTLRRKTALFDTLYRFHEAQRLADRNPEVKRLAATLQKLEQDRNGLLLRPWEDPRDLSQQMTTLSRQCDRVQADLNRLLSREMPRQLAAPPASGVPNGPKSGPQPGAGRSSPSQADDVGEVQRRLPRGAALVEFQRDLAADLKARNFLDGIKGEHYFAFVLTAGHAAPKLIDLGDTAPIDRGIRDLLDMLSAVDQDYSNGMLDEKAREQEWRDGGEAEGGQKLQGARQLYRRLFASLRPALAGATLVYLAPDGELNRLPFEALVGPGDKYLAETYRFAYLSSGRDLLRPRSRPARGTLVFASPNYNLSAAGRLARLRNLLKGRPANEPPGLVASGEVKLPRVRGLRGSSFDLLRGAAAEAQVVKDALTKPPYLPVKVFQGDDALEGVFEAQPPRRVLHLATHGFFYPEPAATKGPLAPIQGLLSLERRIKKLDNPLLRSGFVLAGANVLVPRGQKGPVRDGWVTAAEVALLDLHGTDLVVLSACKTGLGDVGRIGEGVSGLRRAFQYAGARTLVTSLFSVPDAETRELMKEFYTGLAAGKGKLAALHNAQLSVIHRRRRGGAAHPFFWAGFVLVGSPD